METLEVNRCRERARELSLSLEVRLDVPMEEIPGTLRELGSCRRDIAVHALEAGDPAGWMDLLDGITRFGNIGDLAEARALIGKGREFLEKTPDERNVMERELLQLEEWLNKVGAAGAVSR